MKLISIIPILILSLYNGKYKPNPVPELKHEFMVIAHRGDHTIYPENTIMPLDDNR